jgi:hypothetical protein
MKRNRHSKYDSKVIHKTGLRPQRGRRLTAYDLITDGMTVKDAVPVVEKRFPHSDQVKYHNRLGYKIVIDGLWGRKRRHRKYITLS